MKTSVAFLHTSPAAIAPVMQFYSRSAPELEITNLLDDGILRFLSQKNHPAAESRLREMLHVAQHTYGSALAMVTCSSVLLPTVETLQDEVGFPVLKIDGAMARRAVESGERIGVAVTFEPTIHPTSSLIETTAHRLGKSIQLDIESMPAAYQAVLSGDTATHDRLLLEGVEALARRGAHAIVLAQVSMARVLHQARERVSIPVYSSLDTSLDAVRRALASHPPEPLHGDPILQ